MAYVFNDTEVRLTGRVAHREHHVTRRGSSTRETLVEVTPVKEVPGGTWTKWVKESELYTIEENNTMTVPLDLDDAYREDEQENAEEYYGAPGDDIIAGIQAIRQQKDKENNE